MFKRKILIVTKFRDSIENQYDNCISKELAEPELAINYTIHVLKCVP